MPENVAEKKRGRGRPQKYPNLDTEAERLELIDTACNLFIAPFDDRVERDPDLPSVREVAREMSISPLKVVKLLVSGGYYSTQTSRQVAEMINAGLTPTQICKQTGKSVGGVYSYIPYLKGSYGLDQPGLDSEKSSRYRDRRTSLSSLQNSRGAADEMLCLWKCVCLFEGYGFRTSGRGSFDYSLKTRPLQELLT